LFPLQKVKGSFSCSKQKSITSKCKWKKLTVMAMYCAIIKLWKFKFLHGGDISYYHPLLTTIVNCCSLTTTILMMLVLMMMMMMMMMMMIVPRCSRRYDYIRLP